MDNRLRIVSSLPSINNITHILANLEINYYKSMKFIRLDRFSEDRTHSDLSTYRPKPPSRADALLF